MLKMAQRRCNEIMQSFKSDSTGLPNVYYVREKELMDSPSYRYRWFENGYKFTDVSDRYRNRFHGIYKNSFSKQRNIFDEPAKISFSNSKKK